MGEDDKGIDQGRYGPRGAEDNGDFWYGGLWEDAIGDSVHERVQVEVRSYPQSTADLIDV
jgi:hypothetical protein